MRSGDIIRAELMSIDHHQQTITQFLQAGCPVKSTEEKPVTTVDACIMHYLHLILLVSTLPENKAFRGLLLPRRLSAIRVTVINILLAGYGNVIFSSYSYLKSLPTNFV